mgnify:CR=1 FL=1
MTLRRVSELPFCKLVKPVSGALAHETGFTNKGKRALFLWKWAFSGLLFLFKSLTCPLLYATQAVAGSTFFSNQKKVAKRIFTRLERDTPAGVR